MLKFFSKINTNAFHLFNKCAKDVIFCIKDCKLWYTDDNMKKRPYVNFLPERNSHALTAASVKKMIYDKNRVEFPTKTHRILKSFLIVL